METKQKIGCAFFATLFTDVETEKKDDIMLSEETVDFKSPATLQQNIWNI
jgi:hypothetical protein